MNRWLSEKFPEKYSSNWLFWFVSITIILFVGLWIAFTPSKYDGWHLEDYRGIMILAGIAALFCVLPGYFSLKKAFIITLLAVFWGLIQLSIQVRNIDGWGDLIGLLSFMMITAIGLLIGLIVEFVFWLKNRNK